MKKVWLVGLVILALSIGLCGCATVQLGTPTGKPEVTIPNVTKKQVVDALVNQMLSRGYQIHSINDYTAIFKKRIDSIWAAVLLGSKYDSTPEARISFNIVETGEGIRVIATLEAITNPGSAFERVTDFSKEGKDAQNIQDFLERLKISLTQKQ